MADSLSPPETDLPRAPIRPVPPIPARPPSSSSRLERIGDHAASLSKDLREWVELRIELTKAEVREKLDEITASAKRKGVTIGIAAGAALLALYGLGFVFGAISAGFASWLGHEAWGDAATAVLIFLIAGVLLWIAKRRLDADAAIEARARIEASSPDASPGASS